MSEKWICTECGKLSKREKMSLTYTKENAGWCDDCRERIDLALNSDWSIPQFIKDLKEDHD